MLTYLHTMVRVTDIDASLHFYRDALGLDLLSRRDSEAGRFTLVFLAAPGNHSAQIELTYNWPALSRPNCAMPSRRVRWPSCKPPHCATATA